MRNYVIIMMAVLGLDLDLAAQEINWRAIEDNQKHILSLSTGVEFASYYAISYGYKLGNSSPLVLGGEVSIPYGNDLLDDWKWEINVQKEVWSNRILSFSLKPGFSMKRYKSEAARLLNSSLSLDTRFGLCRSGFAVFGEAGFDKFLFTNIKNGSLKDYYGAINDGWYTSTGGNFKFGIGTNYSVSNWGFSLSGGRIFGQDFKDNPTVPFYINLAIQRLR